MLEYHHMIQSLATLALAVIGFAFLLGFIYFIWTGISIARENINKK